MVSILGAVAAQPGHANVECVSLTLRESFLTRVTDDGKGSKKGSVLRLLHNVVKVEDVEDPKAVGVFILNRCFNLAILYLFRTTASNAKYNRRHRTCNFYYLSQLLWNSI